MGIFLSHTSALQFWASRTVSSPLLEIRRTSKRSPEWRTRAPLPPEYRVTASAISELQTLPIGQTTFPLHMLVAKESDRSRCRQAVCHVSSCSFPRGSFVRIAKGVFVSSPELCFVQMARELSLPFLIRLGFELCGTYGIATVHRVDYDFRHPLTTLARLKRFIEAAGSMPGTVKASKALKHIAAGSASPMETTLTMLLCLPLRMGGYSLSKPLMNGGSAPARRSLFAADDKHYYCDLLWPDARMALEYDSMERHATPYKLADDARRRNGLLARNIIVISVTTRTVRNLIELDQIARTLSKKLGTRARCDKQAWRKKQHELHGALLGSSFLTVGFDSGF